MIKGVIFDLDGVIADAQWMHAKAQSMILKRFGVEISPDEITRRYAGVASRIIFSENIKNQDYVLEDLYEEKKKIVDKLVADVKPIEGAIELIKRLHKEGYKLGVASSPDNKYVNGTLEKLGVTNYFITIVSGDQVSKKKPSPDIFLKAVENLDLKPSECVVIEDAPAGMLGAINGGMKCIGIVEEINENYPTKNIIKSMKDITIDYLNNIK